MKIAFNHLVVEITRKCQLQCGHCLRGDAQNINIGNTIITTLLNKTSDIEHLAFTGGEPTLNIEGMKFFLDTMIKNDIHLSKLTIVTNGVLLSEQFIELLKGYYDWIKKSNSPYKKYIHLEVSDDKYHQGVDVEKAVNFYNEHLKDYSNIKITTRKVADINIKPLGRAKKLFTDTYQNEIYELQNIQRKTKIEVLTKNNKTFCPGRKFEEVKDNEARILCPLVLTAKGDLIQPRDIEYIEEDKPQNKICNVEEDIDILWWIRYYNSALPHCIEFDILKQSIIDKNLQIYRQKKIFENLFNINNIINLLVAKEKWNKHADEVNKKVEEYEYNYDDDEISFEPSADDIIEVFKELEKLREKNVAHYLKEKNQRQPTDEDIYNEIRKLYQRYEISLTSE